MMNYYIGAVLLLLIAVLLFRHLAYPNKGNAGEAEVGRRLRRLSRRKYRVVNDVMLRSGHGSTEYTQIDHVVVSVYGLFSIETKSHQGEIRGTEHGSQWTQRLHGQTYHFMNPIRQNYAHVKALEAMLRQEGYRDVPVYSIVTFPGETKLQVETKEASAVTWPVLVRTIRHRTHEKCLTRKEMCALSRLLSKQKSTGRALRRHVADIQHVKKEREKKIRAAICPRCGGDLLLRRGKRGRFYSCSNYPKCRFTEDIR